MIGEFDASDLSWIDELADNDFIVIDNFIALDKLSNVHQIFQRLIEQDDLKKAGVGSIDYQVVSEVRGDFIHWIDPSETAELDFFFDKIEAISEQLNRYCYLGLKSKEFHYALYPKGSFYEKHLDQFQERNNRMISIVFYLNENWKTGDGGELKIYKDTGDTIVQPLANRLVLFRSDIIEHEVLKTTTSRKSITGWLLRKPPGLGFLS